MTLKLLTAAALAAGFAAPSHATLLVNGSFESGLTGWTVGFITNGSGNISPSTTEAFDGVTSARAATGADNFRTLSQNIATTIGSRYLLTYSVLNQTGTATDVFEVTSGPTFNSFAETGPLAWTTFTQEFFATAEVSLIRFALRHNDTDRNSFIYLDATSLIEIVPEPDTWAMLIAGFGLVGAAARRRRHNRAVIA